MSDQRPPQGVDAHLARLAGPPPRVRPGSYAWPGVRQAAERLFARGVPPAVVARRIARAEFGHAQPPTNRTIARGHTDRRWLTTGTAAALPF